MQNRRFNTTTNELIDLSYDRKTAAVHEPAICAVHRSVLTQWEAIRSRTAAAKPKEVTKGAEVRLTGNDILHHKAVTIAVVHLMNYLWQHRAGFDSSVVLEGRTTPRASIMLFRVSV